MSAASRGRPRRAPRRPGPLAPILLAAFAAIGSTAAGQAPLAVSGSNGGWLSLWEDRGSALVPRGAAPAFAGGVDAELRAETSFSAETDFGAGEGFGGEPGTLSRAAFEGALSIDAAGGAVSFAARELWAEWRPIEAIALRVGRQRLGFGSGLAWNPSNDLDPPRYATDLNAPRIGSDSALLRLEAGGLAGFPLSLSLEGFLPPAAAGTSLAKGRAAAQIYALVGELELMLAGSLSDPGGSSESWLAGGWLTFPLGPAVLGLEGGLRSRADLYRPGAGGSPLADREAQGAVTATATLRSGDFVLMAEVNWSQGAYSREEFEAILASPWLAAYRGSILPPGSVGKWHGLARLAWAAGDLSAALGAVADLETGAFLASADLEVQMGGRAGLALKLAMPAGASLMGKDELGLSGRGWSCRAGVKVNY